MNEPIENLVDFGFTADVLSLSNTLTKIEGVMGRGILINFTKKIIIG